MAKLLRAEFTRMLKYRCFWACMALSVISVVLNCTIGERGTVQMGRFLLQNNSNIMPFCAVFAAMFIGTDHSNGTLRNKLIVGRRRSEIYLSWLITVTAGTALILAAKTAALGIAALFRGTVGFGMSAERFALETLIILFAAIAICAMCVLTGALITSRSANTAVTIGMVFVILIAAAVIYTLLSAPEFVPIFEMTENSSTGIVTEPNPNYIKPGLKRDILTTVYDILPGGQLIQQETGTMHNAELMPLWSLGVITVTTAAGVMVFRKKDIK